jgi:hypothetical protein
MLLNFNVFCLILKVDGRLLAPMMALSSFFAIQWTAEKYSEEMDDPIFR